MARVEILGVYPVLDYADVYMFEVRAPAHYAEFDLLDFMQPDAERDPGDWVTADDERYLNPTGDRVIGDHFNRPDEEHESTRVAFFLEQPNFARPLETPFGKVVFPKPQPMPERLARIIAYDPLD